MNNPVKYNAPTGHTPVVGGCNFYGYCTDTGPGKSDESERGGNNGGVGGGGQGRDQPGGIDEDLLLQQLSNYYENALIYMANRYESYTDLWVMRQLILKAFDLTADPTLAMKMVTAVTRQGGVSVPGKFDWEFPESDYFNDYGFDDSGFGDLADNVSPNQISHFARIAYITLDTLENNGGFFGTIGSGIMIEGNDLRFSKTARIDRALGYIAQQFAKDIYGGMDVNDALDNAMQAIQNYPNRPYPPHRSP